MKIEVSKELLKTQIGSLMKKIKESKVVKVALVMAIAVSSFFLGRNLGTKKSPDVVFSDKLNVVVVEKNIEVYVGTPDQQITDSAKYAVSATYKGEKINSKDLSVVAIDNNMAQKEGSYTYSFVFTYKDGVAQADLGFTVKGKEPVAANPVKPEDVPSSEKKAVVNHTALKTPIKSSKMEVLGLDGVKVDSKGFHNKSEQDVVASKVESTNTSTLEIVAEEKVLTEEKVDTMFDSTKEEVEEAINEVDSREENEEIKVSVESTEKVEEATSKEVETDVVNGEIVETTVKVTADLLVIKLADGTVINLTSNLSGDVNGASQRLIQSADGTFTDGQGNHVDFNLGSQSTRIVDGFATPVVVYNTNAGLYYVA